MKLGIVGAGPRKWSALGQERAKRAIGELIERHRPEAIVVGESEPEREVIGTWAIEIAGLAGIAAVILRPDTIDGSGYRARNTKLAEASDLVACIVPLKLPSGQACGCTYCGENTPPHVVSFGCFAAWRAARREWVRLSND